MNEIEKIIAIKDMADDAAEKIAESMSTLFGLDVEMDISSINLVATNSILKFIGIPKENVVASSFVTFSGFLSGSVLTILSIKSCRELANILLAEMEYESSSGAILSEMEQSSIMELCNIITSMFIDTWANTLYCEVTQHPPDFTCDCLSAIIEASPIDISDKRNFAFMFDSSISITDHEIDLEVLVLPDLETMLKIFDRIILSSLEIK